jgi:hypothetical protein
MVRGGQKTVKSLLRMENLLRQSKLLLAGLVKVQILFPIGTVLPFSFLCFSFFLSFFPEQDNDSTNRK